MQIINVTRDKLREELKPLRPIHYFKKLYFRYGAITQQDDNFVVSATSSIGNLDLTMRAEIYNRLLKHFRCNQLRISEVNHLLRFEYGDEASMNIVIGNIDLVPDVNLWDAKIEWHKCPEDLVDAIRSVVWAAGEDEIPDEDDWDLEQFLENIKSHPEIDLYVTRSMRLNRPYDPRAPAGIHVSGHHVCAFTEQRVSRYRMSFPAPFEMVLPADIIKRALTKRKEKLIGLAQLEVDCYGELKSGVIFDFGHIRLWIPDHPADNAVSMVNRKIDHQVDPEHYVELPDKFKQVMSQTRLKSLGVSKELFFATIKFAENKIVFKLKSEKLHVTDEFTIKTFQPIPPIMFQINSMDFAKAFRRKCLIGFKALPPEQNVRDSFLYVKDKDADHVLGVLDKTKFLNQKRRMKND